MAAAAARAAHARFAEKRPRAAALVGAARGAAPGAEAWSVGTVALAKFLLRGEVIE